MVIGVVPGRTGVLPSLIGGNQSIGSVAGKVVPVCSKPMCLPRCRAHLNAPKIPHGFRDNLRIGLGLQEAVAAPAVLHDGSAVRAGVAPRVLFSRIEAGQGSARLLTSGSADKESDPAGWKIAMIAVFIDNDRDLHHDRHWSIPDGLGRFKRSPALIAAEQCVCHHMRRRCGWHQRRRRFPIGVSGWPGRHRPAARGAEAAGFLQACRVAGLNLGSTAAFANRGLMRQLNFLPRPLRRRLDSSLCLKRGSLRV